MAIRSYCQTHNARTVHKRGRCVQCHPEAPKPATPGAEVLEFVIPPKVSALDVIRARGDLGATVREVIDAGADACEMVELEREGLIEQRVEGYRRTRNGASLYFATAKAEARAA